MIFTETPLAGAFVIDLEPHVDERGSFARTFCREEFTARGLRGEIVQTSLSRNPRRGTLRGLHFQLPPMQEIKVVRCPRGAVFDVIADLRTGSPTFARWHAVELTATNGRALYIPEGFAHGFLTLEDDTEIHYAMSQCFDAARSRGVRWDDPALGIAWPFAPVVISARDREYTDLDPRGVVGVP